jgi:hypothetical protein
MSRNIFSGKLLGCWLLAATTVLAVQLVSWAQQQCTQPNPNQLVACYTPNPPGVGSCRGLAMNVCGNSKVYDIDNFPTTQNTNSGSTTQQQSDCWQVTPCEWVGGECVAGTILPGPNTYYQAAKTVNNSKVKCPPGT